MTRHMLFFDIIIACSTDWRARKVLDKGLEGWNRGKAQIVTYVYCKRNCQRDAGSTIAGSSFILDTNTPNPM